VRISHREKYSLIILNVNLDIGVLRFLVFLTFLVDMNLTVCSLVHKVLNCVEF
jgi:hypothetical protein